MVHGLFVGVPSSSAFACSPVAAGLLFRHIETEFLVSTMLWKSKLLIPHSGFKGAEHNRDAERDDCEPGKEGCV